MNMKKVLAGAVASVMAVSTLAAAASAADVTVDGSKVVWGDIEQNGNLRIELFNAYGPTATDQKYDAEKSPIVPDDVKGGDTLTVTFTIAGLPADMETHTAALGFADGSWTAQSGFGKDSIAKTDVKGDGTYTLKASFENTDGDAVEVTGATVFVVDIIDLATTLGVGDKDKKNELADNIAAAKEKVTISDVKVSVTNSAEGSDDKNDSADTTTAADATTAADTTTGAAGNTDKPANDKNNADTGIEGVAIVAGLAVLAAGAVIVAKKRK